MTFSKPSHFFGELEAEIMEIIWIHGKTSVRDVLAILSKRRKVAYTTVMTVMARLYEKGVLERKLNRHGAYEYEPRQTREEFLEDASKKIITNLLDEFGEVAVAQFIDILQSSDLKEFAHWRKKLSEIK